jgi:hypothetical protein
MSNTFRQTIQSLKAEVLSTRHVPAFEAARGRHDVLAAHNTIASVLGVLSDERRDAYAQRDALTRALIAEQQSSPSSFWSAVLLLAYYPMLSRLRHRIYGDAIPSGDLDQIVITMFLTVVTEFPLDKKPDRTAMRLRQRTERRVFRLVREDQRRQEVMRLADPVEFEWLDDPEWPEVSADSHRGPRNPKDAAAAVALLVEHAAEVLDGEAFDLVTATAICGRKIPAFLRRVAPELEGDERVRVYQRIKRRHSRALAKVRPALAHLRCPQDEGDSLCLFVEANEPKEARQR